MISNIYIAKNVYGGDGLGRLGDGRVVFVPGAWAGEQVRAEIVEEKRSFVKARLVEVVEASADRMAKPELTNIPGAVYGALSYEGELKVKEQQLAEFFERARIVIPAIVRPKESASPLNYRNKVVYHFVKTDGKWQIGYHLEKTNQVIDVVDDPLARPEINRELADIRRAVITLLTTGPLRIQRETAAKGKVTIRWTKASGVKWWIGDAPKDLILKETTAGLEFEVPAGGFYQVNPQVGEQLVEAVIKEVSGASRILDLYCGVGVFGLASRVPVVVGIESGREAIEFAKRNAVKQKAMGAKFFAEEVGCNLRRIPIGRETTVIVDPPRDGMERGVAQWLVNSGAPKIVYVSCDPATLMRDLREICQAYRVAKVEWFNMFPRTARFETMVVLERLT